MHTGNKGSGQLYRHASMNAVIYIYIHYAIVNHTVYVFLYYSQARLHVTGPLDATSLAVTMGMKVTREGLGLNRSGRC